MMNIFVACIFLAQSRSSNKNVIKWVSGIFVVLVTPLKDIVVRAGVKLTKFHHHWSDQLLRLIDIGWNLVIIWVCVSKDTDKVIEANVRLAMLSLQHQHL